MALERWDPFREGFSLRDAINRLVEESVVQPGGGLLATGGGTLPLDISETEHEYVVRASLPGVNPEEVEITVRGATLTLRGEHKAEEERQGERWLVSERRLGAFQRSVTFPTPVTADQASAEYEHGVLTLTLPKAEEARPKRITVGGTGQPQIGRTAPRH